LYEELYQDGKLCAKGKAIYVNYDLKKEQSLPIPDDIRKELKKHMREKV